MARYRNFHFSDVSRGDSEGRVGKRRDYFGGNTFAIMTESKLIKYSPNLIKHYQILTWISPPRRFAFPLILSPFNWWWWFTSEFVSKWRTSGLIRWSLFVSVSLKCGDDLIDKSISAEGTTSTSCDECFESEMPLLPSNFVGGDLRFDDIICKK